MELKPINRICPRCGNGNYMRVLDGKNVGKLNVKCINCNSYYNYDVLLKGDNSESLNRGVTMADLISRAAAIVEVEEWAEHGHEIIHWTGIKAMLEVQPTVDAVPVVRCRDCKYYAINRLTKAYEPDKRFNPSV